MHSAFKRNSLGKYAIFAIYPGTTSVKSCLRMLDSLKKNGFTVIVVLNQNNETDSWVSTFIKFDCVLIERLNVGRDFGAYQSGLNFLLEFSDQQDITQLILVNDTCYVSPKSQERFLDAFFAQDQMNCLMKHSQGVIHGSSSLLNLGKEVLESSDFFKFWRRYYPHNNRIRVVFRGEHKLSESIGTEALVPATNLILGHNHHLRFPEITQLKTWMARSRPDIYEALFQVTFDSIEIELDHVVNFALENLQVSNSLGLYLSREFSFPLKLDLPYYLLTTKQAILALLRESGCDESELEEIRKILDKKKNISVGNFFNRTLRDLGVPV